MMENEIALVTGASRGIGRAIAVVLGQAGARVAGTATTEEGAQRIQQELIGQGVRALGLCMNVTDSASMDAALARISDEFGAAPSILVNNAGITKDNLMMRMKDEEWDAIIATDLSAVFHLTKRCMRAMTKARHGRIINITSVVGFSGNAGQTNYAAAKAGLVGFSKSLAREIGGRGVTVNCVAPGFIATDMTSALPDAHRDALLGSIPLGRLGQAEEVAAAVAFLASPQAGYITGETLHVNGGMLMD
ncbi:3-oxoacyl-ACP reductase FabG [Thiorhodovibrio frisius]|uniref:3-oxoacyl-[acyl-carrier-protein] reductase n=1 Tax=Thiorhodovibrio frisius TaxID=631362 RepID=H8Z858_9GAMM|nr:3-oxoacyl-ACP reductase FabG [Thiorhodovibrio frisius]EIC19993.1 3-oxoacyl-(acyl-carrier-protein) reductase [Thiorhodovibrio frisius]WPL20722.1 3-oxoacyl-[acyl-carrier-protein] reductase FabG [Thiorhodovibrio frisius]